MSNVVELGLSTGLRRQLLDRIRDYLLCFCYPIFLMPSLQASSSTSGIYLCSSVGGWLVAMEPKRKRREILSIVIWFARLHHFSEQPVQIYRYCISGAEIPDPSFFSRKSRKQTSINRRCNRGNLLLWSLQSLSAPSGNHIYPFVSSVSGLWQFLFSTSRPRCPHHSGSNAVLAFSVLLSNRINIQMSAVPLSPQLQLSRVSS